MTDEYSPSVINTRIRLLYFPIPLLLAGFWVHLTMFNGILLSLYLCIWYVGNRYRFFKVTKCISVSIFTFFKLQYFKKSINKYHRMQWSLKIRTCLAAVMCMSNTQNHSLAIYNHVNVSFYFYQGKQMYFKGKCTILIKSTLL